MKRPMYVTIGGVQSAPRVMRGAPVFRPSMFDVPLVERDLGADIEMPKTPAAAAAPKPGVSTNLLILGVISVAAIYLLGRR